MAEYWLLRQAETLGKLLQKTSKEIEVLIGRYYQTAINRVIQDFCITFEKVMKAGVEGTPVTPADLYKLEKYWSMENQLTKELEKLGKKEVALLAKKFSSQYSQVYKALDIKSNLIFGKINSEAVNTVINEIWCADGKNWSNRIWDNVGLLKQRLNETLINCVVTGLQSEVLKKKLIEDFQVSYRLADTVVRTELAHIQTEATKKRYEDAGIKKVLIWADYDERRCKICGELHKKIYPVNAAVPIPAHPNCRCSIIPVIE